MSSHWEVRLQLLDSSRNMRIRISPRLGIVPQQSGFDPSIIGTIPPFPQNPIAESAFRDALGKLGYRGLGPCGTGAQDRAPGSEVFPDHQSSG